jgi:SET domain-containing protein 6
MEREELLTKWLRDNQIEWDRDAIEIHYHSSDTNNYCPQLMIKSRCAIDVDSTLAVIPKSAILSVRNSSLATLIRKHRIGGGLALVLTVMYERSIGEQSRWYGYLQSLPVSEPSLPFLWPAEKRLELLCGTEVGRAVQSDNVR